MTPRILYMRCTENRVEDDYDGGVVLLQAVERQEGRDLLACNLVMSFATDEPMLGFPVSREEKQARFFRLVLEDVDESDLPPDPNAPPPPDPIALLTQAIVAARASGNDALAERLAAQLAESSQPSGRLNP